MRIVGLVVAFALGTLVGVLGAFVHSMQPRVLGIPLPAGLLLALAAHVGVLVSTGLLFRTRVAIAAPAAGWLIAAFLFSIARPEGDLVVTASFVGYGFLLGGAILIGLSLAVQYAPLPSRPATVRRRELT